MSAFKLVGVLIAAFLPAALAQVTESTFEPSFVVTSADTVIPSSTVPSPFSVVPVSTFTTTNGIISPSSSAVSGFSIGTTGAVGSSFVVESSLQSTVPMATHGPIQSSAFTSMGVQTFISSSDIQYATATVAVTSSFATTPQAVYTSSGTVNGIAWALSSSSAAPESTELAPVVSTNSSSRVSVGAIVGGVLGGVAVLLIGLLVLLLCARRRRQERAPSAFVQIQGPPPYPFLERDEKLREKKERWFLPEDLPAVGYHPVEAKEAQVYQAVPATGAPMLSGPSNTHDDEDIRGTSEERAATPAPTYHSGGGRLSGGSAEEGHAYTGGAV